jgi:O-antigen/teichoic acid export membrane protein
VGFATASYLAAALGIVTGPLVARSLGAEGRGEYAAILIYSGFTIAVVALGITQSINHALQTLRLPPRRVLGVVWRFCGLAVLPSALIAGAISLFVLRDFSNTAKVGAAVFVMLAPMGILQLCLSAFLLAEGALGVLTRVKVAPLLISAVAVIVLALFGHLTLTTYLIATGVSMLVPVAMTIRSLGPSRGGRLGPQLKFGLRAYPGSLASLANFHLDQALIAPFLGASDLGFYAIAVSLSNLPLGLVQGIAARGISQVALPSGAIDTELAGQILRRGVLLSGFLCICVAIVVPLFVPLVYGSAFATAVPLCVILLFGTIALAITTITSPCLTLAGRPGATSFAELASLTVTVASLLVMLPLLGVTGAALASSLAYWTRAVVQLRALRQSGVNRFRPTRADVTMTVAAIRERMRG